MAPVIINGGSRAVVSRHTVLVTNCNESLPRTSHFECQLDYIINARMDVCWLRVIFQFFETYIFNPVQPLRSLFFF